MKFILFKRGEGGFKQVSTAWMLLAVVPLTALGFLVGVVLINFLASPALATVEAPEQHSQYEAALVSLGGDLQTGLKDAQAQVLETRQEADIQLRVMAGRVAELQARLTHMESLARRIAEEQPGLASAVDFSAPVAAGGPGAYPSDVVMGDVLGQLQLLESRLVDRERQLGVLNNLVVGDDIAARLQPKGRPIVKGWLSSPFGKRTDPFTGKEAWHSGIDFAGAEGSEIIAVADGLVTYAGRRQGYGLLIEIAHADGYSTRYAHNRENLVAVGEKVTAGQMVGRIGNSGRSTGAHVHFELLKGGKKVSPLKVVSATR